MALPPANIMPFITDVIISNFPNYSQNVVKLYMSDKEKHLSETASAREQMFDQLHLPGKATDPNLREINIFHREQTHLNNSVWPESESDKDKGVRLRD